MMNRSILLSELCMYLKFLSLALGQPWFRPSGSRIEASKEGGGNIKGGTSLEQVSRVPGINEILKFYVKRPIKTVLW